MTDIVAFRAEARGDIIEFRGDSIEAIIIFYSRCCYFLSAWLLFSVAACEKRRLREITR